MTVKLLSRNPEYILVQVAASHNCLDSSALGNISSGQSRKDGFHETDYAATLSFKLYLCAFQPLLTDYTQTSENKLSSAIKDEEGIQSFL